MGEFTWPVGRLWSLDQKQIETVDAAVDTGASYSVFPESLLERMGIWRLERGVGFEQADGTLIELDVGVAWMTINGRSRPSSVAFGHDGSAALLVLSQL